MARLTSALLRKAAHRAWLAAQVQQELTAAFTERYGTTYSDIDADQLIDILDYGGGGAPTLAECDEIMTDLGHPPLAGRAALAKEAGRG